MSERSKTQTDEDPNIAVENTMGHYKKSMEGITPLPRIKHVHMVRLDLLATVDEVPLTSDDLDTAIQIVNDKQDDDFYPRLIRGGDIGLGSRDSEQVIHTTNAGPIQEYFINSALRYLASRPSK